MLLQINQLHNLLKKPIRARLLRAHYLEWLEKSFKKVTCAVTPAEFAMLKQLDRHLIVTESRLDNAELAVVLCPRHDNEWPEFINLLKLWK